MRAKTHRPNQIDRQNSEPNVSIFATGDWKSIPTVPINQPDVMSQIAKQYLYSLYPFDLAPG
jgi:hypothetical protein